MKKVIKSHTIIFVLLLSLTVFSCKESFLDEVPLDRFSPENIFVNEAGFEAAIVALYQACRQEHAIGGANFDYMNLGTDLVEWGRYDSRGFKDYYLLNSQHSAVEGYWRWAYTDMVRQCNLILDNLESTEADLSEQARQNFSGQAKFFRAYAYNVPVTLYGGVPIVANTIEEPKFDFQRASREEVLQFIRMDLEEASQELPIMSNESNGRIYRAAAFHLLSEVLISLGMETGDPSYYDQAIQASSTVINGEAGDYQIMTERFGDLSRPGDVFSDLFYTNQQNLSSGNREVIWSWQFESFTIGGATSSGGNNMPRLWYSEQEKIRSPNGYFNIAADSLIRGIGVNSLLNYLKYDIWRKFPNDMRNSKYNIRRTFYYNNPEDAEYFGKPIKTAINGSGDLVIVREDGSLTDFVVDTLREYYPSIRKVDGHPFEDNIVGGKSSNDIIRMRLAETFLLRAEAYFRKGDLERAADDINVIRSRAQTVLVAPSEVTLDFLLDERARELITEEQRRRTLMRMGVLYDRVKKYNPSSSTSIQPHNELWPIPQSVIDSNTGAELEQNPGY